MGGAGKRLGHVDGRPVEQTDQLSVEPGRAVLAAPQLVVVGPGPARRDGAVDQADPAVDQLDGLGGGRDELLQHRPHDRNQHGDDPRDRRLRDLTKIAEELLRRVLAQVHAGGLHRPIQPE
jgi:hypothetical protein